MSETKEPEQILEQVFDLLRELEKCKVKAERPIPIVTDRRKGAANELELKDWLQKLNEEVDELKYNVMEAYSLEDVPGGDTYYLNTGQRRNIVEELCDVIEVLYSMANQMGIDGDMIQQGIHKTNKKLRERGCID
jgi:NTP pyrophosphatase (non-canonical NTP hydrolase)